MIVVFGSINVDLVARAARLPRPGETLAGVAFAALPGGKGANQALAARRAGAAVTLVGAVGTDAFAGVALAGLKAAGVDVDSMGTSARHTGVALIHVDAQGENSITVIAGANADADPAALPSAILGAGSDFAAAARSAAGEGSRRRAARPRRRCARRAQRSARARACPKSLLAAIDVLVVNEIEAATIAVDLGLATAAESFAADVHRRFGCAVVVTRGARGAIAAVDDHLLRAPAPQVKVVDTIGAGDAFVGAMAAALDRGAAWPRALADGVTAGALACTAAGAQAAMPDAAAIANLSGTVESNVSIQSISGFSCA